MFNINKIPIPILGLCKAIPCNTNTSPMPKFLIILQSTLLEILIPSCNDLSNLILLQIATQINGKVRQCVMLVSNMVDNGVNLNFQLLFAHFNNKKLRKRIFQTNLSNISLQQNNFRKNCFFIDIVKFSRFTNSFLSFSCLD